MDPEQRKEFADEEQNDQKQNKRLQERKQYSAKRPERVPDVVCVACYGIPRHGPADGVLDISLVCHVGSASSLSHDGRPCETWGSIVGFRTADLPMGVPQKAKVRSTKAAASEANSAGLQSEEASFSALKRHAMHAMETATMCLGKL